MVRSTAPSKELRPSALSTGGVACDSLLVNWPESPPLEATTPNNERTRHKNQRIEVIATHQEEDTL